MAKRKSTKGQTMIYKTHKTKDRVTRIPLKTVGELKCLYTLIVYTYSIFEHNLIFISYSIQCYSIGKRYHDRIISLKEEA